MHDARPLLVGRQFSAAGRTVAALAGVVVLPAEAPVMRLDLVDVPASMCPEVERLRKISASQFELRMYPDQRQKTS